MAWTKTAYTSEFNSVSPRSTALPKHDEIEHRPP